MPISKQISVQGKASGNFPPLPKDVYPFELIDIELVTEQGYQTEEMVDKLKFEFACLDESLYGRRLWQRTTLKFVGGKKPSNLYVMLAEIIGRPFTSEELAHPENFLSSEFLNSLIGKQLRIAVGQKVSESDPNKINNKIESYMPAKQQFPPFDKEKSKAMAPHDDGVMPQPQM